MYLSCFLSNIFAFWYPSEFQAIKMLQFSISAVFVSLFASILSSGTAVTTITANVSSSCQPYETPCALGCCPYAQGVCCSDGYECCQHGQTCIPYVGICIGLKDENDKPSLVSEKSTPIRNLITACPPGTTTCGPDRCCLFKDATCCSDGLHCCPHGYRCDLQREQCIKQSLNNLDSKWGEFLQVSPRKMSRKSPIKSCPGSNRICPSYTSCCLNDNGEWSCCPNPSLPQITYGGGECCDTIFGHMCCPNDWPHCTPFGCTK